MPIKTQAKRKHSPPVRRSKREREYSTLSEQKSSSNCDIQRGDPIANRPFENSFKRKKSKKQGRHAFFSRNLNFFEFFCGMASGGKFWILGRFVGWWILWFWRFFRFHKRSETASSRFCRWEGNVARILSSKHLFVGTLLNHAVLPASKRGKNSRLDMIRSPAALHCLEKTKMAKFGG